MGIEFSDISKGQILDIVGYTGREFGQLTARKVRARLYKDIHRLAFFGGIAPVAFVERGIEVRRMVSSIDYVYYMVRDGKVYIIAIFDSRMSPEFIESTVKKNIPV